MPPSDARSNKSFRETESKLRPSVAFVVMIFGALVAFEIFNYSTTDHALGDLLGNLTFAGIPWSTILALAFCGIDFAGIARLFTPETGADEPKEVWYLFGAWLLAATMNAILTWWGVSVAVAGHNMASSAVVNPQTITSVVPIFVAIMVWVIRILIIGTLSLSMDRLLHPGAEQRTALQNAWDNRQATRAPAQAKAAQPVSVPAGLNSSSLSSRPTVGRGVAASSSARFSRASTPEDGEYIAEPAHGSPEPTYHTLSMSARPPANHNSSSSKENTGANRYRRS